MPLGVKWCEYSEIHLKWCSIVPKHYSRLVPERDHGHQPERTAHLWAGNHLWTVFPNWQVQFCEQVHLDVQDAECETRSNGGGQGL